MENRLNVLILDGTARGINENQTRAAITLKDQKAVLPALRELGFSFKEIGAYYNRTKAWAAKLLPRGSRAAPFVVERPDPDGIAHAIWAEAAHDLSWWGTRGRLVHNRVVKRFRDSNYAWIEARTYAKHYSTNKLTVILAVTFRVEPTDIKTWFEELLESHTKAEIYEMVNRSQPLTVSVRSFNRLWAGLELKSPLRDVVRFEHQFPAKK